MTKGSLHPFVYWAQSETQLTLKIDLKNAKNINVKVTKSSFGFSALGVGACGINEYKFSINLHLYIIPAELTYKRHDSNVHVVMAKATKGWWPRLTSQPQKPQWLKVDFDRWQADYTIEEHKTRDIVRDYPGMYEKLQKEENGYIKEKSYKVYTIFYNFASFIGYLYIQVVLSILYLRDGQKSKQNALQSIVNALKVCQALKFLGIINILVYYANGNKLFKFVYVVDRCIMMYVIIDQSMLQQYEQDFLLIFLWSFLEALRHSYYVSRAITQNNILSWFHKNVWTPFNAMILVFESEVAHSTVRLFDGADDISLLLPNAWNFGSFIPTFIRIRIVLLLIFGTYEITKSMVSLHRTRFSVHL